MKFRLSKIEMVDIVEKYLFDDNNKKNMMVSIKDLANRFLNEPFALADDDAALLLARYLVEDNA